MGLDPENWMSFLDPSLRVIDTYIPASHDASAYFIGDKDRDIKNDAVGALCQSGSYTAQCNAGSRYFDMRCRWNDGAVCMHHSDYYFQTFKEVLVQLDKFVKAHQGETLFLDIDFDNSDSKLEQEIIHVLTQTLGESRLATAHVDFDKGGYKTSLTWGELKQSNTPFVVMWSHNAPGLPLWAAYSEAIRSNDYDDFDKKSPQEILNYLTQQLSAWDKRKLFATQLINTPRLSPINPPAEKDYEAKDLFNHWVVDHKSGSNLGIVKMDFINAAYKRDVIEHIIRLNTFTSPPDLPALTDPIYYTDKIRLKTQDNRYVCLDVKPHPQLCKLTLVDNPTEDCNFLIRDYDYKPRKPFPYSGNLSADTLDCHGNFRMAHLDRRPVHNVGNDTVLSVDTDHGAMVFWGIGWGPSDRNETFCCFDPDWMTNDGQVYNGSRVMIITMLHASNNNFVKFFNALGEGIVGGVPIAGRGLSAAVFNSPSNRRFWMLGMDENATPRVYSASPGTLLADTFLIEKVSD